MIGCPTILRLATGFMLVSSASLATVEGTREEGQEIGGR